MTGDSEMLDTLLGGLGWTSLTISADLPLVTSEIIDLMVERYARCNKPALTIAVPLETKKRLGLGGNTFLKLEVDI